MSRHDFEDGSETDGSSPAGGTTAEERIRRLEAENERLRTRYAASHRSRYRRTALGLATVGAFAGGLAAVAPAVREPLIGIAAIGLFSAVITRYLTPERFIPADVGRSVFEPLARNEASLVDQLGLSDECVYLESEDGFRLYVPQRPSERPSAPDDLTHPLVVTDDPGTSGLSLRPSGAMLYREHAATRSTPPTTVSDAGARLGQSLRENFELVQSFESSVDADASRYTVEVTDPAYGDPSAFDHPVVSFVGVGLAAHLGRPVNATVSQLDSESWAITYRW